MSMRSFFEKEGANSGHGGTVRIETVHEGCCCSIGYERVWP